MIPTSLANSHLQRFRCVPQQYWQPLVVVGVVVVAAALSAAVVAADAVLAAVVDVAAAAHAVAIAAAAAAGYQGRRPRACAGRHWPHGAHGLPGASADPRARHVAAGQVVP